MKINYYSDTDSLYIDLSSRDSIETREISAGVNLDYDKNGGPKAIRNAVIRNTVLR